MTISENHDVRAPLVEALVSMRWWYGLSLTIIVFDQFTKQLMSGLLALCGAARCETIEVLPVFRLIMLHNEGAAFSFLHDAGGWQRWFLVVVSVVASVVLVVWVSRLKKDERWTALSLSLILGGAVGNLIDRAMQGYVVDFLLFHYENMYFPAFNVADTAISIGGGLMILELLLGYYRQRGSAGEPR